MCLARVNGQSHSVVHLAPGLAVPEVRETQTCARPRIAFHPDGWPGTVYACQQPQDSTNPTSVSQYDVACFQVSQAH